MVNQKLSKAKFMQKVIRHRLEWKYNINDVSFEEMYELYHQWNLVLSDTNAEQELMKSIPITKELYNNMKECLITKMKDVELIPREATNDDIDMNYIDAILESFLYANKVYIYCTIINPDSRIGAFKELNAIKGPMIKAGCDTILALAILYTNTYDAYYIKNIGPVKYKKFQDFFALNFGVNVIE